MRYVHLDPNELRCRPVAPLTARHNDCGKQGQCARALASNTVGAPQDDLSRDASTVYAYLMRCPHFLSVEDAQRLVSRPATKEWPGG